MEPQTLKQFGKSALATTPLGCVVILVASLLSWQMHSAHIDNQNTQAALIKLLDAEQKRGDDRMTNLYQNMRAIAEARNTDATNIALILEYMRILPQNRGSMPMPESPKPVELKPPPTIRD